jgi:hypothetical protein
MKRAQRLMPPRQMILIVDEKEMDLRWIEKNLVGRIALAGRQKGCKHSHN